VFKREIEKKKKLIESFRERKPLPFPMNNSKSDQNVGDIYSWPNNKK